MRIFTAISLLLCLAFGSLQSKTIYVAADGDDGNPGTLQSPFRTIAKGTSQLFAGDTLLIRQGRYTEILQLPRSGQEGNPIVIMAYPGEQVVLTALEPLSNWELDEGSVYKTSVNWNLGQQNFVMYGDTACDLARWPNNTDGNKFTLNSLRNSGGSGPDVIYNAYLDYSGGIPDFDWSKGGSIFFYGDKGGAGWIAWKSFIKSSSSSRLTFDLNKNPDWIRTWHSPTDLGDFFLEGIREAIDYPNEWYFDEAAKVLYLQVPGGIQPPDSSVFMRRRVLTIKLNQDHVHIKNLEVYGGSIEITGSNNHIYGIRSRWGHHHRGIMSGFSAGAQSLLIQGSANLVEKCDIGHGAATGVKLSGSFNKVINCRIHNFNSLGSYDAPVMARDGVSSTLSHNTISRGGRDAVHMSNNNSVMSYNDVSRSNLIADDCGLFYCTGGPHNISIHHNWFHDTWGRGKLKKAAGIYLDSSPKGFTVHHNVIWNTEWSSIQMNKDARDIHIYNNTLWDASSAIGVWHADGTHFERVVVYNNLANNSGWDTQTDYQNNLSVFSDPFVNKELKDWQLKAGTQPVDYGRTISGITDGYTGLHPDAGAYEYGQVMWKAGIDWDPELGPDVCLEEGMIEEVDGLLIIDAEEEPSSPVDSTLSSYRVQINHPGTYRILLRSRLGDADDPDMENHKWIHVECDEFYGAKDEIKYLLDTSFASFSAEEAEDWTWGSRIAIEEIDSLDLFATFNYSGTYTVRIAGGPSRLLLNRIALFQEGREQFATDSTQLQSPSPCEDYLPPDPWATPRQAKLYFQMDEPVIDGTMEEYWVHVQEYSASQDLSDEDSPAETDLNCTFKLSFNDSALFLVATLTEEKQAVESLNLYLNPDNSHYSLGVYGEDALHLQFYLGSPDSLIVGNGSWKAADFSNLHYVTKKTEEGWILEARIPWSGIYPVEFEDGSTSLMGFELQLNEGLDGTESKRSLAWANNTGMDLSMYDTRKFGTIALIKDVELIPVRVSGVNIVPDTIQVDLGQIVRLTAQVLPEDADNQKVSWQVGDSFILYLIPSSEAVKGLYPGTTYVVATTEEGSLRDSSVVVVRDPNAITGTLDRNLAGSDRDLRLVPNPATESFRISGLSQWEEVEVYSMTGERLLQLNRATFPEAIPLEGLAAGLYLVRVSHGGQVSQKKLLKVRD